MLSYIKSELYRAKKSNTFKALLLVIVIFVPFVITLSARHTDFIMDYYEGATVLAITYGTVVVGSDALFFTFKNKDIKTQILGHGISKDKLYWWDFIAYNILLFFIVIIIIALMILMGFILSAIFSTVQADAEGMLLFIKTVLVALLLQINVSSVLYGFAFVFDKAFAGIILNYAGLDLALLLLISALGGKYYQTLEAIHHYLPSNIVRGVTNNMLYAKDVAEGMSIVYPVYQAKYIAISFIVSFAISHILGLIAFKKREIN